MLKLNGVILAAGLVVGGAAAAQMGPGGGPMGPSFAGGPVPPEIKEIQKAQVELMEEEDPELYAFQEKQQGIEEEIAAVAKSFAAEEIDKDEARAELQPLIKERQELRDDPAFQTEQILSQAAFSTPEFQKKMAKIQERMNKAMQRLMAKRLRTPNTRPAPNALSQSGTAR